MKKIIAMFAFAVMALGWVSCSDDDNDDYRVYAVEILLATPEIGGDSSFDMSGIEVVAKSSAGTETAMTTDENGKVTFNLPEDSYSFSASYMQTVDGVTYPVNYVSSYTVTARDYSGTAFSVTMNAVVSQGTSQIIIKEVYAGGCQKEDGSGVYQFDKYMIIYNNSPYEADIKNFCVGMVGPYTAHATANNYVDGKLNYADAGYTPSIAAYWYLPKNLVLAPYASATIVLNAAINHTKTYNNSVDLSEADYVTYDPEPFNGKMNTSYYPTPSEKISSENYFKACWYGVGTAWAVGKVSPGMFIFSTGDEDPAAWGQSEENRYYSPGKEGNAIYACAKIPNEWIFDAVEIWGAAFADKSLTRYSASVDAGYICMTNDLGYSIYRNVDKSATEALAENEGLLVYNYSLGTTYYDDSYSTDPSGIDAEASIKNGAHIIYKDTNNSTNDFHQRAKASLKD